MRRCITMAMGCLDPHSANLDERLAWYRLKDALDGREPRNSISENWGASPLPPPQSGGEA